MLTILAVIAALFVGTAIGMLIMELCVVGKREPAPDLTELEPGNTYALQTQHEITKQEAEHIHKTWVALVPEGVNLIVIDGRYRLSVLSRPKDAA